MSTEAAAKSLIPLSSPAHQLVLNERRTQLTDYFAAIPGLSDWEITLEIGCGHGHFLAAYAKAHPAELCIGVDIESARIERADRKRSRANLSNLHFVRADARLLLEVMPAAVRLRRVFVLFPDPWPKSRHHKHRIMQEGLLSHLAQRATPASRIYFRTDYEPYAAATRALVVRHRDWVLADEPWPFEFETVFQSRAERHHSLIARPRPRP